MKRQNSNINKMQDLYFNNCFQQLKCGNLSYDVASGGEITPCNKICKPLVVYQFSGKVMTSITTLRHNDKIITFLQQK